jgi:hypothetical protein
MSGVRSENKVLKAVHVGREKDMYKTEGSRSESERRIYQTEDSLQCSEI